MPGRGKRLSAQPLVPVDRRASPEKGDRRRCSARFGHVEKSSRAFSARGMFGKFPGAARSGACPWLPALAPPAPVRLELKCPNSSRALKAREDATVISLTYFYRPFSGLGCKCLALPGAARCALAPGYPLPRLRRCLAEDTKLAPSANPACRPFAGSNLSRF